MSRFTIIYTLLFAIAPSQILIAAELAEVSYRRRPSFLNGEHVTGVWHLKPGDTVSTGGGRAYVTAKYLDSTRIGVMPNAKAIFQPGWVDLIVGPLDVDVVRGTKHVEQIETPLGIIGIQGATGVVDLGEADSDSSREIKFDVKLGTFLFQVAPDQSTRSDLTVIADKGDKANLTLSKKDRLISINVTKGELIVQVGNDTRIAFPAMSRGSIVYQPDKKTAQVASTRGTVQFTVGTKESESIAQETTRSFSYVPKKPEQLIVSKRNRTTTINTKETADSPVTIPEKSYSGKLPQDHPYQVVLRDYMATLTEKDFDPGKLELTVTPPSSDKEDLFRTWLLSLDRIPRIGRKRSAPSVSAPARLFLLETIEGSEAIMRPPAWPEPLSWLANWNYPGNPYFGSKALKNRAFITAAVLLLMIDHAQEHTPEIGVCRADWMSHHLVLFSYTYPLIKDVLPAEVQKAYLTGLRKITEKVLVWGPKGESIGMDMAAAVGLFYAAEALEDQQLRKAAREYGHQMFSDPNFFNPAGYFVSLGGYDASYNGQARFYGVWLAMASDYEFTKEPLSKAYRLRAHLSLPEPDGTITGPTHFNAAASRDAYHDQYEWPFRDYSGAMLTDEAAHLTKLPTDEELAAGGKMRITEFVHQIKENPGYVKPEELTVKPWYFRPWPNSWSFPQVINYAQDHYRPGSYAHRALLEKENSPMLKLPLHREENFVRHFEKEFTVSKNNHFATVLHTGKIAADTRPGIHKYHGPYGFGGGQLSAFWTPKTGAIILGRRAGMNFDRTFDHLDEWQQWPIHAVTGRRHNGAIFTTARIRQPNVQQQDQSKQSTVTIRGNIPTEMLKQGKVLESPIQYQRKFTILADKLKVETNLQGAADNKLIELVETIPVYLRDLRYQRKLEPTAIEFQIDGKWQPATAQYQTGVTGVSLTRFDGKVIISFQRPRRVKLSSADWQDTYMSRAACRNIVIDLLDGDESGIVFQKASSSYTIASE